MKLVEMLDKNPPSNDLNLEKLILDLPDVPLSVLVSCIGGMLLVKEHGMPEDLNDYCYPLGFYPYTNANRR